MLTTDNKIQRLTLEQFTTFEKATFEFCPGINVLIGANSMGKTHVMKVMYAILKTCQALHKQPDKSGSDLYRLIHWRLTNIFRLDSMQQLIRGYGEFDFDDMIHDHIARALLGYNMANVPLAIQTYGKSYAPWEGTTTDTSADIDIEPKNLPNPPPLLYLPSQEFLSINEGFIASYNNRELPYDETYYDLSLALNATFLRPQKLEALKPLIMAIREIISGPDTEHYDEVISQQNGRFYFHLPEGKLESHMVADGYRKLGTLLYLLRNGSLTSDSILFWDEPETSLNPKMIVKVAEVLRKLAQAGVQIFIATHDYLLSHTLSLWAEYPSPDEPLELRFFALHRPDRAAGVEVEMGQTLADIQHNPILEEFAAHYDREAQFFARSDGA